MESAACAGEKNGHMTPELVKNNQLIWFGIFSVEKETQTHTNIADLESQILWKSVYKLHIEVKERESTQNCNRTDEAAAPGSRYKFNE